MFNLPVYPSPSLYTHNYPSMRLSGLVEVKKVIPQGKDTDEPDGPRVQVSSGLNSRTTMVLEPWKTLYVGNPCPNMRCHYTLFISVLELKSDELVLRINY